VQNDGAASVALTNMSDVPMRAIGVEQALASGSDAASAADEAAQDTSPPSDPFGSADYRRALSKVLTRRALQEAMGT
jgi:carbon-monoxide dehydrogenase medium subunit